MPGLMRAQLIEEVCTTLPASFMYNLPLFQARHPWVEVWVGCPVPDRVSRAADL